MDFPSCPALGLSFGSLRCTIGYIEAVSTAGTHHSREAWKEPVSSRSGSSQGRRSFERFAEELVEVGDEILGRSLLYDVTDLFRQVHGLEGSE